MTRKKKIWAIALPSTIAVAIFAASVKGSGITEVETVRASFGSITHSIPANGRVQPVVEVKISPDVSGEIVEICCKEGDRVCKGDLLLRIKPDLYISQVEQAEAACGNLKAEYYRQQAEAVQAELNFRRARSLFEQGAVSSEEFENAEARMKMVSNAMTAAEYAIRSGEAQLKAARENLDKTTIYAPMSGIISRLNVEKGERVVGTSQMAGTELLRVADFSAMEAVVEVNENEIARVALGDSVSIELDSYPDRCFTGRITQIANSAKNIELSFNQVTNFEVRIGITPDSVRFLPGMTASASIITEIRDHIVTVPLRSVFSRDKQEFVWVVDDGGTVSARQIGTGIQDLASIEVLSGIEDGETVVEGPLSVISDGLVDGCKVKVTEKVKK